MTTTTLTNAIEILLNQPDDFLKIKETLERIGIASASEQRLTPSCYILHRRGKYYVAHYKMLFELEGGEAIMSTTDWHRYYTICFLLNSWNLCKLAPETQSPLPVDISLVKIIPYKEKKDWEIRHKFHIGKKK